VLAVKVGPSGCSQARSLDRGAPAGKHLGDLRIAQREPASLLNHEQAEQNERRRLRGAKPVAQFLATVNALHRSDSPFTGLNPLTESDSDFGRTNLVSSAGREAPN